MKALTPHGRVVEALHELGGSAPVHEVERRLAPRGGRAGARMAIDLAVLAGSVERVVMLDGTAGLALTGREA